MYVDAAADLDEALKHRRQRQDAAAERLQRGRVAASCTRPSPTRSCRGSPTRCTTEGVELVGDAEAQRRSAHIGAATDDDFGREFLDLKMSVAVAPDLDAAIAHVNRYGTGHTEAILTRDLDAARRFTHEVDAAAVVVNASTRFTDGEDVRVRRRDRHLDAEVARARPDGPARADHVQVHRLG